MGQFLTDPGFMEQNLPGCTIRFYWQAETNQQAFPDGINPNSPLINGPRGFCLDLTNTSGRTVNVRVEREGKAPQIFAVGQGNPVTTGAGRSLTANQLRNLGDGYQTRGDLGTVTFGIAE